MEKRWYDRDPVLKLAINLMEKSSDDIKDNVADYIIEEASKLGIKLKNDHFECFWRRSQDKNLKYFEAIEYLKIIDFESKKEISMEIINYINGFETNIQ